MTDHTTAPPSAAPAVRDIAILGPINGMGEPDPSGAYFRLVLTKDDIREERKLSLGAVEVLAAELAGLLDTPQAEDARLREEAAFLLDRLSDFSSAGLTEDGGSDWYGHVEPSISRLRAALSRPQAQPAADQVGEDEQVKKQCAHYGGVPARCLIGERNWAFGKIPNRCALCPEATRPAPSAAVSAGPEGIKQLVEECRARASMDEEISPETLHEAADMIEHLVALAPAQPVPASREEIARRAENNACALNLIAGRLRDDGRPAMADSCLTAIRFIHSLAAENTAAEDRAFNLAANQCEGPMVGDEFGAFRCAKAIATDAILAARLKPDPVATWQDISTAPKYPEYDVDHDLPGDADEGIGVATRVDTGSPAYLVWWTQTGPGRSKTTHWMPLPASPTPASSAESDGRTG